MIFRINCYGNSFIGSTRLSTIKTDLLAPGAKRIQKTLRKFIKQPFKNVTLAKIYKYFFFLAKTKDFYWKALPLIKVHTRQTMSFKNIFYLQK